MADAEERLGSGTRKKPEKKGRGARADRSLTGLKKEAARQVQENSKKLAKVLMSKALEGHVGSARMVVGLAEPKKAAEKEKKEKKSEEKPKWRRRTEPSMALKLARERQWGDLTPEEQKQQLIAAGGWDFENDCRKEDWFPNL